MKLNSLKAVVALVTTIGALAATPARAGKTLDAIKARGQVVCGVNTGLAGFSAADSSGKWSGLDVDVCRAVAAAVLNDGNKLSSVY
jgi:general L-amino acid transport system substrate-binding protein